MAAVYSASSVLIFVIGLVVSTIVIYFVSRFVGTKRGLKVAFFTAIIGSLIYATVYFLVGNGLLAAVLGGIAWLLALKGLVQNRMDSRIDNGNYHLDYYISCWSFVTHCPRTSMILIAR